MVPRCLLCLFVEWKFLGIECASYGPPRIAYIYTRFIERSVLKCLLNFSIVIRIGWLAHLLLVIFCCVSHCFWSRKSNWKPKVMLCSITPSNDSQFKMHSHASDSHSVAQTKRTNEITCIWTKKQVETNLNETFSRFFFPYLSFLPIYFS